jgi:hypothetical protein
MRCHADRNTFQCRSHAVSESCETMKGILTCSTELVAQRTSFHCTKWHRSDTMKGNLASFVDIAGRYSTGG